jgi:hypothetical protein
MEKVKFSIILKIIFLIFEIIMIGNGIYNMSNEIIISIICYIFFIGLIILDHCFYSYIVFRNELIVVNCFKINKIQYSNISKIEVISSIKQAFLVGSDIDIIISLKNHQTKKIHLGPIIKYNKLITTIKALCKKKCIKFVTIKK